MKIEFNAQTWTDGWSFVVFPTVVILHTKLATSVYLNFFLWSFGLTWRSA